MGDSAAIVGDNYNVKCPHCGCTNHYVANGFHVQHDHVVDFSRTCVQCNRTVYYTAEWVMKVTASKEKRV